MRVSLWKVSLTVVGVILAGLWFAYSIHATNFYRKALPAPLETSGFAATNSSFSILDWVLVVLSVPLRFEACGDVVHRLTPATVEKIREQGLAFFETARQGRGYTRGHRRWYYSYEPWQETPMPGNYQRKGVWFSSSCVGWRMSREARSAFESAREPGSYFTKKPEGILLVILKRGVAVYAYYD